MNTDSTLSAILLLRVSIAIPYIIKIEHLLTDRDSLNRWIAKQVICTELYNVVDE